MTFTATPAPTTLQPVTFDLYRDIHKGIRAELFSVTGRAGRTDPGSRDAGHELASHLRTVVDLLDLHAHHEDGAVGPALEAHLPDLAERVEVDHRTFDTTCERMLELAAEIVDAPDGQRPLVHHLYLDLAAFTGTYLAHQDMEERVIMPALEQAVGIEAVMAIHGAIIGSIPPPVMAASQSVMLPAMNVDDRVELLGGMKAGAPPEVFARMFDHARAVLGEADHREVAQRLGLA